MFVWFVTPVCIMAAWFDRYAAFVLAGYCVITGILYHDFWRYPRFWSPASAGYPHVWDFLNNFGLAGGAAADCSRSDPLPAVEAAVRHIGGSDVHIGSGLARTGATDRLSPVQRSDR